MSLDVRWQASWNVQGSSSCTISGPEQQHESGSLGICFVDSRLLIWYQRCSKVLRERTCCRRWRACCSWLHLPPPQPLACGIFAVKGRTWHERHENQNHRRSIMKINESHKGPKGTWHCTAVTVCQLCVNLSLRNLMTGLSHASKPILCGVKITGLSVEKLLSRKVLHTISW